MINNTLNGSDVFNVTLTALKIYTPYSFKILAYTYRSDGVFSHNITVWTDEYGENNRFFMAIFYC